MAKVIGDIVSIQNPKSGGGGGNDTPFVINFGFDASDMTVGDKTYEEITEAISQGRRIVGKHLITEFLFTSIQVIPAYVCLSNSTNRWYCWTSTDAPPEATNGWEYSETNQLGDIDTALDRIIEIQNSLIGGDGE